MTMKRLVWTTIIVLVVIGLLLILWEFREALLLFVLSLAVAAAVRPAVDYWAKRGLSRGLAILLIYLLGLVALGLLIFLISKPMLKELEQVTNNFANTYDRIVSTWPNGTQFQQMVAERLPKSEELYQAITGERGQELARGLLGVAQTVFGLLSQLVAVLILSIYWTVDRVRFERLLLSLMPARQRTRAREIWRSIELGVGAYIRSEAVQGLLAGLLLGLGYWLIGLPYPVLLALSGALLWLIPWMGAILAVVLPAVAGLSIGPGTTLLAVGYTLLVLLVLEVFVEPRIFNRRRYSSLLIVIVVVAMADAYGLVGLLVAPPLAAAIQIFFGKLMRLSAPAETVDPTVQMAALQTRLAHLKEMLDEQDEEPAPEIESLVNRLSGLIRETNQYFQADEVSETPRLGLPTQVKP